MKSDERDAELRDSFRARPGSADALDVGLARRAAPLADAFAGRLPLERELLDISSHFGIDVANTVFEECVSRSSVYGPFVRRVRGLDARVLRDLALGRDSVVGPRAASARSIEVTIVRSSLAAPDIAWGVFADTWREWARGLGFTTDIIETQPDADIRENARRISTYLFSNPHPQRILVTYGQGAAEFRALLQTRLGVRTGGEAFAAEDSGELSSLIAWINVCGAWNGSAYARVQSRSWASWLRNEFASFFGRTSVLWELRRWRQLDSRLPAWRSAPVFPRGLRVVNVVGLPTALPLKLILSHREIGLAVGPNDGVVGLYESLANPGLVIPVAGLSHAAESLRLRAVFERVLAVIAQDAYVDVAAPADARGLELE